MKAYRSLIVILLATLIVPMIGLSADLSAIAPDATAEALAKAEKTEEINTEPEKTKLVYQIPIKDQIEPALLYVIRRGVTEATAAKADAIIFVMDTPGGRVDITRDIIEIISKIKIPVYTFVEKDAYSAGAIIALATPHIYMAPGSVIGAATPLMMGPMGGVEAMPESVEEKMTSAVAALVRTAAEQGGHSTELAEAMVRRELEYSIGSNIVSKAGQLLTLTASEADGVLSEGTVKDLSALLETIGLSNAEIKTLEVTPAEKLARIIAKYASILLMIGLGGIYLEIKTPGIGLPGLVGAIALALFFVGHHIAGLAGMEDLVLFVIGISLLFVEVFITPGFGVLGIGGIVLIFVSLLNAMSWQLPGEFLPSLSGSGATLQKAFVKLSIGLVGTAVLTVVAGYFLPKSKMVRPLVLSQRTDKESGFTASKDHSELLGKTGRAEMNLHPAGRALFDGNLINVITRGEFIAKGSEIKVVEAHGSRIVIEQS